MPLQISPLHKKILDGVLLQYPYTFFAFGSRTTGKAKDYSDLDLCIFNEITLEELGILKEHINVQPLPFSIDLVVWTRCSEEFRESIKKDLVPYIPDLLLGAQAIPLHHTISSNTPTWDGSCSFKLTTTHDYPDSLFKVQQVTMAAGLGTHIDTPSHIMPKGTTVNAIKTDTIFGWCYIWRPKKLSDDAYTITRHDLEELEIQHGKLAAGSWILFMTGWGMKYNNANTYRNLNSQGIMQFPHLDESAAQFIIECNMAGIAIDTLSPDLPETNFTVHKLLLGHGKYIVENINYIENIRSTGHIIINPLPVSDATEAPVTIWLIQQPNS